MRLRDIKVKNFQCVGDELAEISLAGSDIIFLVGQNNTGKSAVLAAYEYLVTPNQKAQLSDFHGFKGTVPIEIGATFEKEPGDNEEFEKKGLNKWVDDDGLIRFLKVWTNPDVAGQKSTLDPSTGQFEEDGFKGLESHFKRHAPTAVRIPAMPKVDELSKWVTDTMKKTVLKQIDVCAKEESEEIGQRMRDLEDRLLSEDTLHEISDTANRNFQKVFPDHVLSVGLAEGEKFDIAKALEKEFTVTVRDSHFTDVDQDFEVQGHGVVRQAMFNFLGIVRETLGKTPNGQSEGDRKDFLILFEEPEIYLHPQKISLLRDALYDLCAGSAFQIMCTSHNPALIDLSKPHTSIARFDRVDSGTVLVHQAGDDLFAKDEETKQRVQMINRFNPHVCEAFFADEVVVVEGDSEAIVLRELLHKLDPGAEAYILNAGSKNNIPFFQMALTHFRIRQHIVHDCDDRYLRDKEGEVLRTEAGEPRRNSAWTLNERIWEGIEAANERHDGLARRYVHVSDFESAHEYDVDPKKGKPLCAFEFAQGLDGASDLPVVAFVNQILGRREPEKDFTQGDLEQLVPELED
jgi:predicted ATP-dependent endonuclease of OLD family